MTPTAAQPERFRTRLRFEAATRDVIDKAREVILSSGGIIDFSVDSPNPDGTLLSIFVVHADEDATRTIRALFYISDEYESVPVR